MVALAAGIIVALLGVGFGLASAKSIVEVGGGEAVTEPCVQKSSFELALDILDETPIIDGSEFIACHVFGVWIRFLFLQAQRLPFGNQGFIAE